MDIPDGRTIIGDLKKKKGIQFNHPNKVAYIIPIGEDELKMIADPIGQFQKLRPKDAKRVGDEQLDGKTVYVYVVNKVELFGAGEDAQAKIWVDPKTKLPLKIRIGVNSRSGSKATDRPFDTVMIYEDFQWNKKLDPKLFELKVPTGYKTVQGAPGPNSAK